MYYKINKRDLEEFRERLPEGLQDGHIMALKVLPSYLITITKFNLTLAFAVTIKSRPIDDAQDRIKVQEV